NSVDRWRPACCTPAPCRTPPPSSSLWLMKAAGWNEWCFASMGSMSRIVCSLMPEVWSVAPKAPERWRGLRRKGNRRLFRMARWRRSGKNWEGRPWTITPALSVLLDELEEHYPVGNSSLDGTVASKGHDAANPSSDHRPHPIVGPGVVRAVDCWVASPTDGVTITEALRASRDPRIRYVIHNRRIFASYDRPHRKPWEWGPYDGASPHTNHIHISVQD